VYFALAAAHHVAVRLLSVVGRDAVTALRGVLAAAPIDLSGLEVSPLPTYRWTVRHDFESGLAVDSQTAIQHSADQDWTPHLDPAAAAAPVLFAASLSAQLQLRVLRQSRALLVGADTMTSHIAADPRAVEAVMEAADILFVNHHELEALAPAGAGWRDAARSLCGRGRLRAVVVKRGPRGAACVTAGTAVEMRPQPAAVPVDPTGAGDALAGGFLGACAAAERDDQAFFAEALEAGMHRAALAISSFGTDALRRGLGR